MKDVNIYFPIVKMVRTRFNVMKSRFEQMSIRPNEFRKWKEIYATSDLIKQLEEKTSDHH